MVKEARGRGRFLKTGSFPWVWWESPATSPPSYEGIGNAVNRIWGRSETLHLYKDRLGVTGKWSPYPAPLPAKLRLG